MFKSRSALKQRPGFVNSSKDALQQRTLQLDPTAFQLGDAKTRFALLGYLKYISCSLVLKCNQRACSAPLLTLYLPTLVLVNHFNADFVISLSLTYPGSHKGLSCIDMGVLQ